MTPPPFLDTNFFLRYLRQDDPVRSPMAIAVVTRIEQGELQVRTSDTVIFETVFSLQRSYQQPRDRITEALLPLIELPGILLPGKRHYHRVFALYRQGPLGFADCYHVVRMQRLGITEIFSFDTDFDRVPGLTRRELLVSVSPLDWCGATANPGPEDPGLMAPRPAISGSGERRWPSFVGTDR